MEEANWDQVATLPVYHESEERFSSQWTDIPKFGAGGSYRQQFNDAMVGDQS